VALSGRPGPLQPLVRMQVRRRGMRAKRFGSWLRCCVSPYKHDVTGTVCSLVVSDADPASADIKTKIFGSVRQFFAELVKVPEGA
jgi:hypothetical protein